MRSDRIYDDVGQASVTSLRVWVYFVAAEYDYAVVPANLHLISGYKEGSSPIFYICYICSILISGAAMELPYRKNSGMGTFRITGAAVRD